MDETLARIHVVGTSGTGKSVLAARLSAMLGAPLVELDDLHWLPGWRERARDEFRARLAAIVATETWVIAGNYESRGQDLTFPRATAVIWLDYGLPLTFLRALRRTVRRWVRGEECCNGNRESIARALFRRDSILLWVLQTHGRRRRQYPARFALPENAHLRKLVFKSPRELEAWLRELGTG